MRFVSRLIVCAAAMLPLSTASAADKEPAAEPGLKIGEKAPSFTLKDQAGKERTLEEFLKKGKVAIVFYRSAAWWPFCQQQLVKLQADLKNFEDAGTQVISISYDKVEVLAKFADEKKLTFPLLSDSESKAIKPFGMLVEDAKGNYEGLAKPGIFVVDKDGVIRARVKSTVFQRPSNDELLKAIKDVK
jgi:peroxiredoxin